jgi:hypothetical protein
VSATICGHDRETLRWALRAGEWPAFNWADRDLQARYDAHEAVTDPAKLAAIIAASTQDRGIVDLSEADFAPIDECRVCVQDGGAILCVVWRQKGAHKIGVKRLTMPQARAFALRLLDSTTVTAQDIARMIGEL